MRRPALAQSAGRRSGAAMGYPSTSGVQRVCFRYAAGLRVGGGAARPARGIMRLQAGLWCGGALHRAGAGSVAGLYVAALTELCRLSLSAEYVDAFHVPAAITGHPSQGRAAEPKRGCWEGGAAAGLKRERGEHRCPPCPGRSLSRAVRAGGAGRHRDRATAPLRPGGTRGHGSGFAGSPRNTPTAAPLSLAGAVWSRLWVTPGCSDPRVPWCLPVSGCQAVQR